MTRYLLDAYMLGDTFSGHLGDMCRFREILEEECADDEVEIVLQQHVSQPSSWRPTKEQWNRALDRFAEERPNLFGAP